MPCRWFRLPLGIVSIKKRTGILYVKSKALRAGLGFAEQAADAFCAASVW
jgi:hypothetical protein